MLEGLDAVPWDRLTHAYGAAADVPGQLRRLAEGDDAVLSELFGNIWHQGTVYEATAHAVPFLVEILAAPEADTAGVLHLLGAILEGGSYEDAHWGLWSEAERASPERLEKRARELRHVERAVAAVAAHAEPIAQLAHDDRVEVRRTVPYLLIAPQVSREVVARTLAERFSVEDDPLALCGDLFVAGAREVPIPERFDSNDPRPLVRLGLAAATVRGSADAPEAGMLQVLAESVAEEFEELSRSVWAGGQDFLPWLFSYLGVSSPTRLELVARWSKADSSDCRYYAACALVDEVGLVPESAAAAVPLLERWLAEEGDRHVSSVLREALDEASAR